ncbi:hypothetical protein BKA61DRAFT_613167 [Leptodontidium sp. MPI-SDFR-AT-0119]|nr:hypothetical protein BKA61DRAFT_613167 [Leptodontidium sp. MPI-SDFR-AT-0119]
MTSLRFSGCRRGGMARAEASVKSLSSAGSIFSYFPRRAGSSQRLQQLLFWPDGPIHSQREVYISEHFLPTRGTYKSSIYYILQISFTSIYSQLHPYLVKYCISVLSMFWWMLKESWLLVLSFVFVRN